MQSVNPKEFEQLVAEEVALVPAKWQARMKNVAFLTADEPSADDLHGDGTFGHSEGSLLGLYKGIPISERGVEYGNVLPDSITLYRLPILLEASEAGLDVRTVVRETIWHEIAHHFGFGEETINEREDDGTNAFGV